MIFVSDQAFISKWWWIGAIRNTRRPQYLNETTWRSPRRASMTKIPPIRSSSSSVFVITAKRADRAAERHRAGVAHDHLGREGVVPEEADRAARSAPRRGSRGRARTRRAARSPGAERIHVTTVIAANVISAMIADADREPVDAVREVRAVRRSGDDDEEQDVQAERERDAPVEDRRVDVRREPDVAAPTSRRRR